MLDLSEMTKIFDWFRSRAQRSAIVASLQFLILTYLRDKLEKFAQHLRPLRLSGKFDC